MRITSLLSSSMLTGGLAAIVAAGSGPAILTPAYANTLSPLIPDIYAALDVVSREMVGFFPSSSRNMGAERAALGQSVKIPVGQVQTAVDIAPAMQVPEPPDNVFVTGTMSLTKARAVPFGFTGEEQVALGNGGPGYLSARGMIIAEALRALVNEVETDLAVEASANASRAYGTPGTTPFTGDQIEDAAQVRKILDDNGAPATGRSLVLNTSAGAKLRSVKNLSRVNEAGTQMTLRQGELLDLYGMSAKESAQTVSHTKGTAAGATTDDAGYAVGDTVITLASAGTGTILDNDTITFAGDTNKYVVVSGDAAVAGGGTITIEAPGLRVAIPAADTAITVGASYAANVAFSQNALHVAMRPPAIPQEGDLAVDRMIITDPRSGMSFEIAIYLGYKKVRYEVSAVWGVKAVKKEHIALLLG